MDTILNKEEIIKSINLLKPNAELFEIRLISGKWNASGYFTNPEKAYEELSKLQIKENANIYITLNVINPACYDRKQKDKFIEKPTETTSDKDIVGYKWLMIDIDPKRPSGTSSTDEQVIKAKEKAKRIYQYMKEHDFYDPIMAMSGNGIHLLYRIELKNTKENTEIIKGCLNTLSMIFSDEESDIDTTTYNPARICKLYGTKAQKGSNTKERPHREAKTFYMPKEIKKNTKEIISKLSNTFKQETEITNEYYKSEKFNLEEFIDKYGIQVKEKSNSNGATKYLLEECLFDANHKAPDAAIFQMGNGAISYYCFHNSCQDKKWQDVRLMFEPDAYNKTWVEKKATPNFKKKYEIKQESTGKSIKTIEEILTKKDEPTEFIPTGIKEIDYMLGGLRKQDITIMSGFSGSGKSSILSELAINVANEEYKTIIYSGEMTAKKTLNWIELQAAGRDNIQETSKSNFYKIKDDVIKAKIDKWLNDKIFIYDNDCGDKATEIINSIETFIKEKKVDMVIIDNLMIMDLSDIEESKYDAQKYFIKEIKRLAQRTNTHIIVVAHPRKASGFLRIDDISGTGDIRNLADNVLLLHRINNDFKTLTKITYQGKPPYDDTVIDYCDNTIEIAKNRATGIIDKFIPLYFESCSKRLCNYKGENKMYKWIRS